MPVVEITYEVVESVTDAGEVSHAVLCIGIGIAISLMIMFWPIVLGVIVLGIIGSVILSFIKDLA